MLWAELSNDDILLYFLGGRILLACRDMKKCENVKKELLENSYNTNIHCRHLDLASMKSIRKFADDINKSKLNNIRLLFLLYRLFHFHHLPIMTSTQFPQLM